MGVEELVEHHIRKIMAYRYMCERYPVSGSVSVEGRMGALHMRIHTVYLHCLASQHGDNMAELAGIPLYKHCMWYHYMYKHCNNNNSNNYVMLMTFQEPNLGLRTLLLLTCTG